MKREAVQEERQRGSKIANQKNEDTNPTSTARDFTIDRIYEAEQKSESRCGDNAIPYLKVGQNSVVQGDYKVGCLYFVILYLTFWILKFSGSRFTFV